MTFRSKSMKETGGRLDLSTTAILVHGGSEEKYKKRIRKEIKAGFFPKPVPSASARLTFFKVEVERYLRGEWSNNDSGGNNNESNNSVNSSDQR